MIKVSVIIPVHNSKKYLVKCLDSICNQTLSDIEIICINDCSSDNSFTILKKYANKDSRFKLIDFSENKGVSYARNTGIKHAMGEYIGFVDSDDWVEKDFFELLYTAAVKENSDCAKGNIYNYNLKTGLIELSKFYDKNNDIKNNQAYFLYGFTSAIYKLSFIKNNNIYFPEGLIHFEDPLFSIKGTLFYNKISIVNNAKYYYLIHSESACNNCKTKRHVEDFSTAVKQLQNLINNSSCSKTNYFIYLNFLLQQLIPWCDDIKLTEENNKCMISCLNHILKNTPYSFEEVIESYFIAKRKNAIQQEIKQKKAVFEKLRKKISINKGNENA